MGRGAAVVGRPDRGDRHLLCRRGLRFPRQLGQPGGARDRAAVGGVGHLYRPLLPGRAAAEPAGASYDALMVALDHDRRDLLGEFAYFKDPNLAGPAPVDDDPEGDARDAAVREHIANFRMPAFIAEFRYHDDALPYDPAFTPASFSPLHYAHRRPRRCRGAVGFRLDGWRRIPERRDRALSDAAEPQQASAAWALGPRRADQCVALAPGRDPEFLARRRAAAVFRHLPDGAGDRALAGSAGALFHDARRNLAGGAGMAPCAEHAALVSGRRRRVVSSRRDQARTGRRPISASAAARTRGMAGWRRTTPAPITTTGSRAR